ncbi:MAG TPA: 2-oxoglutarate dehydrogenase E1 component [Gammaproteobacteria bacterium]|nr:2-oxoglutarate dehydrogenase E1 component [Gammaproteobacteria bacterium]
MNESYQLRYTTTPFSGGNAAYIEALYEQFLENPGSVPAEWGDYFRGFQTATSGPQDIPRGPVEAAMLARARAHHPTAQAGNGGLHPVAAQKQAAVIKLIESYRGRGHLRANLDPLDLYVPPNVPDLDLAFHGLSAADMNTVFSTVSLSGPDRMPLKDIWSLLQETYCGTLGFEFMHVTNGDERLWVKDRIESVRANAQLKTDEKLKILDSLVAAEGMEKYLHTRYVGQKRFSIEGGESLIAMLHDLVKQAGGLGVREAVIGMAHRGRLNVLINMLGKSPREIFSEFEGSYDPKNAEGSGDVKYHLGFSSDVSTPNGSVHLALAFNPSHLEIVNPVVVGSVRARQDRRGDLSGETVLPVLIHGDAALSGQGIGMETLQLSQARGFHTGGTIHIVLNNQIGFTISNPHDARSTPYCTDLAKMLEAPVFHVNGDDPEAAIFVTRLALEYRQKFHKDVFIDLVCYRRHGHNEADEPAATQPIMYQKIRNHPTSLALYAGALKQQNLISDTAVNSMMEEYRNQLDSGKPVAPGITAHVPNQYTVDWSRYQQHHWHESVNTRLPANQLKFLTDAINRVPAEVQLHPTVARIYDARRKMAAGAIPMDWGFAELLSYASLVTTNYPVRLTGQDTGRGTFFHRHAVLHNQKDGSTFVPLEHVAKDQKPFAVVDSLLSEEGVMGFEYGYSTAEPDALVIWEAQYGDFANGAQVVIDQFISAGEAKWSRLCGLVLLLPHGYEGAGPEHSSARLERYLQLCAEHNMQVCVPSTPAQLFHMLRRQVMRPYRKPLVVMSPKSLLRHKLSVSSLSDLTHGRFHVVIPEIDDLRAAKISRVVFCSGKVYFDLLEARRADKKIDDIAIVRLEQLYPFPHEEYAEIINLYINARDIVWCQEEPQNQGAWYEIRHRLVEPLKTRHTLRYVGRAASASPAAGYAQLHKQQQIALIQEALSKGAVTTPAAIQENIKTKTVSEKT